MFNIRYLFVAIIICCTICCQQKPSSNDDEKIKAVLVNETIAYINCDIDEWSSYWLHEPYIRWQYTSNIDNIVMASWDTLNTIINDYFKNPDTSLIQKSEKSGFEIHNYGKVAFVRYDNKLIQSYPDTEIVEILKTSTLLEKRNNEWKIVNMDMVNKTSYND